MPREPQAEIHEQTRIAEVVFGGGDDFYNLESCAIFLSGSDGAAIYDCPPDEAAWIAAQTAARRPVTVRYTVDSKGDRRYHGMVFRHHPAPEEAAYENQGPEDDPGDPKLYAYRHTLVEVSVSRDTSTLHFRGPDLSFEGVPAAVGRAIGAYTARGLKSVVIFRLNRIMTVRLRMNPDRI